MITLLILLTGIWMLALMWAVMEFCSIFARWWHDRAHEHRGSFDVE